MQPDSEKGARDEADEADRLAKLKASMTEADLAELTRVTEELRLRQETPDPPEALRVVPCLSLKDIPKKPTYVPIAVHIPSVSSSLLVMQSGLSSPSQLCNICYL